MVNNQLPRKSGAKRASAFEVERKCYAFAELRGIVPRYRRYP